MKEHLTEKEQLRREIAKQTADFLASGGTIHKSDLKNSRQAKPVNTHWDMQNPTRQ